MELLKALSEAPGVPGREERVKDIIRREAGGLFDEMHEDAMGNLVCLRKARKAPANGPAPKVLFACHIDEIGFYVRAIDKEGRLRVINAGGFDTRNLFARRVLVQGKKDLPGVLNPTGKPIHIATDEDKKKIPQINEFFVDLFLPKEKVTELVRVGDPVTLVQTVEKIGEVYTGKAMDNRVASAVAIEAIRQVGDDNAYDIYYVATVQEEVGLRGAGPSAYNIDPDVAIALDTTLACDTPGISEEDSITRLGSGVCIKIMDNGTLSHRQMVDEFIALAERNKIPYQLQAGSGGSTDAASMQRAGKGYRAINIAVPTRYIHTIVESVHEKDVQAAIDLLSAWLKKTPGSEQKAKKEPAAAGKGTPAGRGRRKA